MNKYFLLVILLSSIACKISTLNEELQALWNIWKTYHNKIYAENEDSSRFNIFIENYKKIIDFNEASDNVKLKLNQFADMTQEEFGSTCASGYFSTDNFQEAKDDIDYDLVDIPVEVNWKRKGAVTPIKNQEGCRAGWAFSTTGVLEGFTFVSGNKLVSYSEQQLIDCDRSNRGCEGGDVGNALMYTAANGIETEKDYPFKGHGDNCAYDGNKARKINLNYRKVDTKNTNALKATIAIQPVSVAVQADQVQFQFYSSGIITKDCGDNVRHGMLAIGYTKINGVEAFIVKNSWGIYWGQRGYIHISTNQEQNRGNGVCGILKQPIVPTK